MTTLHQRNAAMAALYDASIGQLKNGVLQQLANTAAAVPRSFADWSGNKDNPNDPMNQFANWIDYQNEKYLTKPRGVFGDFGQQGTQAVLSLNPIGAALNANNAYDTVRGQGGSRLAGGVAAFGDWATGKVLNKAGNKIVQQIPGATDDIIRITGNAAVRVAEDRLTNKAQDKYITAAVKASKKEKV